MANIYVRMAAVSQRLLEPASGPGTFGQGTIELVRVVPAAEPAEAWEPPAEGTREVTTLKAAARGVGKELIGAPVENGGQIVATDLVVIAAPWGGSYEPTDVIEIDGLPVTILKVENIPAAGTVCAVRFVVRR